MMETKYISNIQHHPQEPQLSAMVKTRVIFLTLSARGPSCSPTYGIARSDGGHGGPRVEGGVVAVVSSALRAQRPLRAQANLVPANICTSVEVKLYGHRNVALMVRKAAITEWVGGTFYLALRNYKTATLGDDHLAWEHYRTTRFLQ
ncbi:hypothetical protein E2C01_028338 [Portunus trituberculatus]|uniref:Uncharacterized protein n=1 Tax=Portunus trituberculatus TaxID=210409 RepID=A0A5B7ERE0_PORTR|nr:hypothetical protein [Portunus trituberculatus]